MGREADVQVFRNVARVRSRVHGCLNQEWRTCLIALTVFTLGPSAIVRSANKYFVILTLSENRTEHGRFSDRNVWTSNILIV